MTVRQSGRVEDHGASGGPTSFREVAVDHILLATTDLGTASQALSDRFGLQAVEGGRHPDWGTANWIVPVGDAYLELVAVVDERVAERSAFGRWVARADAPVIRPIGWAVRTGSLDAVATRLGLTVHAGSRASPTGERLTWRLPASRCSFMTWVRTRSPTRRRRSGSRYGPDGSSDQNQPSAMSSGSLSVTAVGPLVSCWQGTGSGPQ
jgi:hypothetical protein